MDPQNLSKVERGEHAPASLFILALCIELRVSPDYIVLGPDRPEKAKGEWVNPDLLWESGVDRRARREGGEVNSALLSAVRRSRLGQKARLGERFSSVEELDAAVELEWAAAEAETKRTTKAPADSRSETARRGGGAHPSDEISGTRRKDAMRPAGTTETSKAKSGAKARR